MAGDVAPWWRSSRGPRCSRPARGPPPRRRRRCPSERQESPMSFGPASPGPPRGAAPERDTASSPLSTQLFLPGSSQQRGPEEGALTSRELPQSLARVLRWAGPSSGNGEPAEVWAGFLSPPRGGRQQTIGPTSDNKPQPSVHARGRKCPQRFSTAAGVRPTLPCCPTGPPCHDPPTSRPLLIPPLGGVPNLRPLTRKPLAKPT